MARSVNPCGKQVTPEMAYEVWQSPNRDYTTFVLKKYKSPEGEAADPYAAWFVATKSPATMDSLEYGDTYAAEVKRSMIRSDNPLCSYLCLVCWEPADLTALGIPVYHQTDLEEEYSLLHSYYRVAVPKSKLAKFKNRLREFVTIRIVCEDDENYMLTCERDVFRNQKEEN